MRTLLSPAAAALSALVALISSTPSSLYVSGAPLVCADAHNWDSFVARQFTNFSSGLPFVLAIGTANVACAHGARSFTFDVLDTATCAQLNTPTWNPQWILTNANGGQVGSGVGTAPGPISGPCINGGTLLLQAAWVFNMTTPGSPQTAYSLLFS